MKTQNIDRNDQNAPKQGAVRDEGKRMVNPASPDLSGEIGKRKAQDYPGADEGLTGQSGSGRSSQPSPEGDAEGQKANLASNADEDDDEDQGEGARGWDSAGNAGEATASRNEERKH